MSAIIGGIIAGASLAGTTIEQLSNAINTGRNVSIEITNATEKYTLEHPRVYCNSGYCLNPPQPTIPPKVREACTFTKTSDTACGSVGVMTYKILNSDKTFIGDLTIMFSVPYNYNAYKNVFALGIDELGVSSCDENLYKMMYYGTGAFNRSLASGSILTYSAKPALVKGTMSPAGKSIMKVELWDV